MPGLIEIFGIFRFGQQDLPGFVQRQGNALVSHLIDNRLRKPSVIAARILSGPVELDHHRPPTRDAGNFAGASDVACMATVTCCMPKRN